MPGSQSDPRQRSSSASANLILASDLRETAIEQDVLPTLEIARIRKWLDCDAQLRLVLEQAARYPGRKGAPVHWADLQSMYLQQTADGSFDRQHVIHEPLTRNERRTKELRRAALHVHRSVVTKSHHVGDTASVAAVGRGDKNRCACRVSTQVVVKPGSTRAPYSHSESGLLCRQAGCSFFDVRAP